MPATSRFLRALVADPRSQRAIDETILDVRAELAAARHSWAQLWWFAQSTAAVARVVLRVLPLELRALAAGGGTFRLIAWTLLLALPLVAQPAMSILSHHRWSGRTALVLVAALLPQGLALVLPVSCFLAALWPRRGSSPAALQAAGAVVVVFVMIQLVPLANQFYRSVVFAALSNSSFSMAAPARGLQELTLVELARAAVAGQGSGRGTADAQQQLVLYTGLMAVAGTFTLYGALLARRARAQATGRQSPRLWPFAVGMPGLAFVLSAVLSTLLHRGGEGVGFWIASLIAFALAIRVTNSQQLIVSRTDG